MRLESRKKRFRLGKSNILFAQMYYRKMKFPMLIPARKMYFVSVK